MNVGLQYNTNDTGIDDIWISIDIDTEDEKDIHYYSLSIH